MTTPIVFSKDVPLELQLETLQYVFQLPNYDVDLTLLSSRKAPEWVNSLILWQHYWKQVRLNVPGEAWYRVDRQRLKAGPSTFHEQPWRTSMRRMLNFADRLFCYPEDEPSDPNASPADFPHPARLRDSKSPRKSIDFEILCKFDHRGADEDDQHWPIFEDPEERINIRAVLWL